MKRLASAMALVLVSGAVATQSAMAQGTTPPKQQPTAAKPATPAKQATTTKTTTVKTQQAVAPAKKQDADTIKKGQTGAKHTRRHHKKASTMKHDSTTAKKTVKKADEK